MGASRRRELGAFYTPPEVAAHMARMLVGLSPDSTVWEPSGGDGALVSAVVASGRVAAAQVCVTDVDPTVEAAMASSGVRFSCRDTLLSEHPDGWPAPSHVLGNPPYLAKGSGYVKGNRAELRRRFPDVGASETYAMFAALALRRLRPGGQMVLLVSDTWLTLGAHRKFRELLLGHTVASVTLLPSATFPDAAVSTVIVDVRNHPAPPAHRVEFHDVRGNGAGVFDGGLRRHVAQAALAARPGAVFTFDEAGCQALATAARCESGLLDGCDGGLGMFTRANGTALRRVWHGGPADMPDGHLSAGAVDGAVWRGYLKRGGATPWWAPLDHAVAWDDSSRAGYQVPASALHGVTADGRPRPGVAISGVAARLTARLAHPDAMWDSNKVFAFFPADPQACRPEFLLAALNSDWYGVFARAVNHTVSLQRRDVAALPMLPFTAAERDLLAALGSQAVAAARAGAAVPPAVSAQVDAAVAAAAARA